MNYTIGVAERKILCKLRYRGTLAKLTTEVYMFTEVRECNLRSNIRVVCLVSTTNT